MEASGFKALEGPVVGVLLAVARACKQDVLLPQIVADEFLAHRLHEAQTTITAAQAAAKRLARIAPGWARPTQWPDPEAIVSPVKATLEMKLPSMPRTNGIAEKALRREAYRQAPASRDWDNPGGARDAAVWLTALDAARTGGETVYLVSGEARAFGKNGRLLPELQAEADALPTGKIVYCGGLEGLLHKLAEPRTLPLTATDLAEAPQSSAAADEIFRWAGIPLFSEQPWADQHVVEYSPPVFTSAREEVHAYRVDDTTWATFHAKWTSTVMVDSATVGPTPTRTDRSTVRFELAMTLLARLDQAEQQVAEIEVLDVAHLIERPTPDEP